MQFQFSAEANVLAAGDDHVPDAVHDVDRTRPRPCSRRRLQAMYPAIDHGLRRSSGCSHSPS